ncbi:AbgT family transporter [bacterium]|nr:AbgT family transporter [bacterium]
MAGLRISGPNFISLDLSDIHLPLALVFTRRWREIIGIGSLTAMMVPYSVWMLINGVI